MVMTVEVIDMIEGDRDLIKEIEETGAIEEIGVTGEIEGDIEEEIEDMVIDTLKMKKTMMNMEAEALGA